MQILLVGFKLIMSFSFKGPQIVTSILGDRSCSKWRLLENSIFHNFSYSFFFVCVCVLGIFFGGVK